MTGMGEGATMPVESIVTPGSGHLKLTGSLGEVRPVLFLFVLGSVRLKCGDFHIR